MFFTPLFASLIFDRMALIVDFSSHKPELSGSIQEKLMLLIKSTLKLHWWGHHFCCIIAYGSRFSPSGANDQRVCIQQLSFALQNVASSLQICPIAKIERCSMECHWFFQPLMFNIRLIAIHSYVECILCFSNILFLALCTFDHMDHIECFTIVRGFYLIYFSQLPRF